MGHTRSANSGKSRGIRVAKNVAMPNWRRIQNLVGETVREVGILVLVFAPLEGAFSDRPMDPLVVIGAVASSLALIVGGILLEARG